MRIVIGAPVALRAWALPTWFERLARQTRQPDGFAFIHSGVAHDETWTTIQHEAALRGFRPVALRHHPAAPHARHDNARFKTLATVRNLLLETVRKMGADALLSLDTDVMLDDPRTIDRLEDLLEQGWDTASAITWLHPVGKGSWAFNAGMLGLGQGETQSWYRPDREIAESGETVQIQVPMAVTLLGPRALQCRYRNHESGEDIGYAQDLHAHGLRCAWDTGLEATHVWSEQDLPAYLEAT
jgi:hypothetical protein